LECDPPPHAYVVRCGDLYLAGVRPRGHVGARASRERTNGSRCQGAAEPKERAPALSCSLDSAAAQKKRADSLRNRRRPATAARGSSSTYSCRPANRRAPPRMHMPAAPCTGLRHRRSPRLCSHSSRATKRQVERITRSSDACSKLPGAEKLDHHPLAALGVRACGHERRRARPAHCTSCNGSRIAPKPRRRRQGTVDVAVAARPGEPSPTNEDAPGAQDLRLSQAVATSLNLERESPPQPGLRVRRSRRDSKHLRRGSLLSPRPAAGFGRKMEASPSSPSIQGHPAWLDALPTPSAKDLIAAARAFRRIVEPFATRAAR
jgi:hypothetical protein